MEYANTGIYVWRDRDTDQETGELITLANQLVLLAYGRKIKQVIPTKTWPHNGQVAEAIIITEFN